VATIQRELGEGDGKTQEVAELAAAIATANMPEEAKCHALKELQRYERMPEGAAEQHPLPLPPSRRKHCAVTDLNYPALESGEREPR
jgi:hypothetical protein